MKEERRLVTVVFADVVGSTGLAEELDAEDLRTILTRYYALANEVMETHGGAVAKLLGDGVLAVFGVPTAHEDDAQRALDASLALRARADADTALSRLRLRIGVNTGEVVATQDAKGEIVGDAVNVAARVAAAAEPDEVLAADATHRAARLFVYGERREIAAKGKSQPVPVWPVTGRGGVRDAASPLVGRSDELAQLEAAARRAYRDLRPTLVTIVAPNGFGKTRLADEFTGLLGERVHYAHAHCLPYGASLAFGPLRELLVALLGIAPDAPADDIRGEIRAALDDEDAVRDSTLIARTIAPEGQPDDLDPVRVLAAWRRLLGALALERPLLLVLEDVQWASESLLDVIASATRDGAHTPLLVLCLARPELMLRRPAWGANATTLVLRPLASDDIEALVSHVTEARVPERLRRSIVERANGNPFFAEELVRGLLERRLDLSDPAAVDVASRALPETVQATLLARLDMLAPEERAVIQAGSVVGRSFPVAILRVLCELDATEIRTALDRLVELDLLTSGRDGEYAFRHPLVREVAYGMLPRARRARDHAMVAQRLETTAGERIEEFAGLIGFHYLEATRLRRASAVQTATVGADEETTRVNAVIWLTRAARTNATTGAWAEAIAQLQEALPVTLGDERIELLAQIGETVAGGDVGWDAYAEALRLWRADADADPSLGARVMAGMLLSLYRSGVSISRDRHPDAIAQERLASDAVESARRGTDELALAAALVAHAFLERSKEARTTASLAIARDEAKSGAAIAERRGEWRLWSMATDAWAAIVGDLGDLRTARDIAMRRIERADRLPTIERAHANWTIPIYAMALGEVELSRTHVLRALAEPGFEGTEPVSGAIVGRVFLLSWRAAANWALGRWDDVLDDAREALKFVEEIPDGPTRSVYVHAGTAALYVARRRERPELVAELGGVLRRWSGDDERALAVLDDDPTILVAAVDRVATAGIDTWQLERSLSLLAASGRVPAGVAGLDALVRDAEARGLRPLLAQLLRLRARARGDASDAKRAHALLAEMGMRADAALATLEAGTLARDRALLGEAEKELTRLGDERGLALLAEARAPR